jgi:hypothetical protein
MFLLHRNMARIDLNHMKTILLSSCMPYIFCILDSPLREPMTECSQRTPSGFLSAWSEDLAVLALA